MSVDRVLVALAGFGLHPAGTPATTAPLADGDWARLVAGVDVELLAGLAVAAADHGALVVTDTQRVELGQWVEQAGRRCRAATQCLELVVQRLRAQAIDVRVLRGAATAMLDYPVPGLRLFDRVHLLVPPGRLREAVGVLEAAGAHVHGPGRGPRRRHAVSLVWRTGVEIRLYRTITPRPYDRDIEPAELFAVSAPFPATEPLLAALGLHNRFLSACLRARFDGRPPGLLAMRDIVQLALRDDLDLGRVEAVAAVWGIEAVVADAVHRAWALFDVPDVVPLSAWAAKYRPARRDRRRMTVAAWRVRDTGRPRSSGCTPAAVRQPCR